MLEAQLIPYGKSFPDVADSAWVAPGAILIGETVIGAHATVLFNCVLRGDIHRVEVGEGSNIQDLSMLHVADDWPCIVGSEVTVGHCALIHGCVIEDGCLIGMGSRVLNGAVIGRGSVVAAGAVVPEGLQVPPGSLVVGVPAVIKGPVSARLLSKLGADEAVAHNADVPDHLRGLPGVAFARKYREVAKAFRTGKAFRPNQGLFAD